MTYKQWLELSAKLYDLSLNEAFHSNGTCSYTENDKKEYKELQELMDSVPEKTIKKFQEKLYAEIDKEMEAAYQAYLKEHLEDLEKEGLAIDDENPDIVRLTGRLSEVKKENGKTLIIIGRKAVLDPDKLDILLLCKTYKHHKSQ
jgi:CO dehydrogenase/acetyl-CoA synthase epsilon subunit